MRIYLLFQILLLVIFSGFMLQNGIYFRRHYTLRVPASTKTSQYYSSNTIEIVGLGDVLLLRSLAKEVYSSDFIHLLTPIKEYWTGADYVVANFEGVTSPIDRTGKLAFGQPAQNERVYTNGVKAGGFNYHESILSDLKLAGINMFTTANNHAFDRGFLGINRTLKALEKFSFTHHGSSSIKLGPASIKWVKFTKKDNVSVAWLTCTNILCPECRRQFRASLGRVSQHICHCSNALEIIRKLKQKGPSYDFLVLSPHWGVQFKIEPPKSVKSLAISFLEAGVDLILGNHPHIPQRAFEFRTTDGRYTYCFYSIGSLTSGLGSYEEKKYKQRTSVILIIKLSKLKAMRDRMSFTVVPICEVWTGNKRSMISTNDSKYSCSKEAALIDDLFAF